MFLLLVFTFLISLQGGLSRFNLRRRMTTRTNHIQSHKDLQNDFIMKTVFKPEHHHRNQNQIMDEHQRVLNEQVSNEQEFQNAIASGVTIDISANILLNSSIKIYETSSLITINGHGFIIDGQNQTRCFLISGYDTDVLFNDIIISNGFSEVVIIK
mmetsp:Transcript_33466/g.39314  ORF Transcript_33466/g.39314 Transcript_33466/m.39314 type:complete len:156 (-) Transcript_33466:570-1037(-)